VSRNNYNFSREGRYSVEGFLTEDGFPDPEPSNGLITDFFTKLWVETISSTPDEQVRFTNWKDPAGGEGRPYRYPVLRTIPEPGEHPRVGERPVIEGDPPLPQLSRSIFQLGFINGDFNDPLMVPSGVVDPNYPVGSTLPFFSGLGNHGHEWTINMSTPSPRYPGLHDTGNAYWIYFNQGFVQGWNTRPVQPSVYPDVYRTGPPLIEDWDNIEFQRPTTRTFDNSHIMVGGTNTNFHNGRALMGYNGRMDTAYAELNAHVASTLYQICQTERPGFDPGQQFYYSFYHQTRTRDHANRTEDMSFFLTGLTLDITQAPRGRNHAGYDVANLTLIRPCWSPRSQPGTSATRPATATRNSRYYNPSASNTVAYGARYEGTLEPYWAGSAQFATANFGGVGGGQTGPFVYDVWIGSQGTGMTGTRDGFGVTFWLNTAYCAHGGCTHTGNCRPNRTGTCVRSNHNRCSHAAATDCAANLAGCVARNSSTGNLCRLSCTHTGACAPTGTNAARCSSSTACGATVPGCTRTVGTGNTPRLDIRGYADLQTLANHLDNANLGLTTGGNAERLAALESRIFGYWDVAYGWKQYYGLYQVPVGQEYTEFAFQSHNVGLAEAGNYLAGIEFNAAPAFLSITNSIRRGPDVESWGGARTPVSFVEPNNALTIHHLVENLGEVDAGTIRIRNIFSPFHELMDYEGGLTVLHNGESILGVTHIAPDASNDYTLTILMPNSFVLKARDGDTIDSLEFIFRVRVREGLLSEAGVSTWMYHIENQAGVGYSDVFGQFTSTEPDKWNHSNVSRVEISEVRLEKHVERHTCVAPTQCPPGLFTCAPASLVDGPFRVTLVLHNTGEETASGIITDAIPHGFTIRNVQGAPSGFIRSVSDSGINRQEHITFPNIILGAGSNRIITYTIESTEVNNRVYGVAFGSNARYVYGSERGRANAMFLPQQVIGLTVKARNIELDPPPNSSTTYDIISMNGLHDSSIIRYSPPIPPWMQADNYMVPLAELILTNASGVPIERDADGFVRVMGAGFNALLAGDTIVLSVGAAFDGTIHYRIVTTASKTGEADIPLSSEVRTITFSS
jgi:hypothetical protein